jgi:hypothetical protein
MDRRNEKILVYTTEVLFDDAVGMLQNANDTVLSVKGMQEEIETTLEYLAERLETLSRYIDNPMGFVAEMAEEGDWDAENIVGYMYNALA